MLDTFPRIAILVALLLGLQSCVISRLISALGSSVISEVYIQTEDTLKLISPGNEEGLFCYSKYQLKWK